MARRPSLAQKARRRYVPGASLDSEDSELPPDYYQRDEEDIRDVEVGDPGTAEFWAAAEEALVAHGREPRPEVIHAALGRYEKIPALVAHHVLARLRGEKRGRRGPPRRSKVGLRAPKPGHPGFWEALERDCAAKREPEPAVLNEALLHEGVPTWVCELILRRLKGGRQKGGTPRLSDIGLTANKSHVLRREARESRHGPTNFSNLEKAYLRELVGRYADYREHCARKAAIRAPDAYRAATEKVAKRYGTTPDVVDKIFYPRDAERTK